MIPLNAFANAGAVRIPAPPAGVPAQPSANLPVFRAPAAPIAPGGAVPNAWAAMMHPGTIQRGQSRMMPASGIRPMMQPAMPAQSSSPLLALNSLRSTLGLR